MQLPVDTDGTSRALDAPRAGISLLPSPGRTPAWMVWNSVRGTWFLVLIHLGALGVLLTEPTWVEWALFLPALAVRGLLTTVGLHRYFSHRSFKTSRVGQFVLACLCSANLQRGPLWWAAVHRQHHRHSDTDLDPHSPVRRGLLWSYGAWMFASLEEPDLGTVRDLSRYPELVWLERFWLVPGLLIAGACYLAGGLSSVCLLFCLTAVVALHGASVVNTLGHVIGSRRYPTADGSRNSFLLAMVTMGDGWHNNHHHYPHAAQAGFQWWEIDGAFRFIRLLERLGLVWGVRRVPPHKLAMPEPKALELPTESAMQGSGTL